MRFFAFALVVVLLAAEKVSAQSQPSGIVLDPNGVSKIYPPFDSEGWFLTRSSGNGTHMGDDYYAQDWSRDCHSQGQRLYAGISGSLILNYDRDGSMDYYGNTLLIVDYRTGFAQRFAHLQEFAPGLRTGDLVLAGQYIGRVGYTGNVTASSTCAQSGGKGAHAHVVLYKNVPKLTGRPITSVSTSGLATQFAVQFKYVSQAPLIKAENDPTVYAVVGNNRVPITAAVFAAQGWNFDHNRAMFDPVSIKPVSTINAMSQTDWFWPMRNEQLIKASNNPTVFLVQDGFKKGLPFEVFQCRGFNFSDVKSIPSSDMSRFLPTNSVQVAVGCSDENRQALRDFANMGNFDGRLGAIDLGTYGYDNNWDPNWELRFVLFAFGTNQSTIVSHATLRTDPSNRHVIYWDPQTNQWSGWRRLY